MNLPPHYPMWCEAFNLRTFSLNVKMEEVWLPQVTFKSVLTQGLEWQPHQFLRKAASATWPDPISRQERRTSKCVMCLAITWRGKWWAVLPIVQFFRERTPITPNKIPINVSFVSLGLHISINRTVNQLHRHNANLSLPQTRQLCKFNRRIYGNQSHN